MSLSFFGKPRRTPDPRRIFRRFLRIIFVERG
jgi:hypothetical protein